MYRNRRYYTPILLHARVPIIIVFTRNLTVFECPRSLSLSLLLSFAEREAEAKSDVIILIISTINESLIAISTGAISCTSNLLDYWWQYTFPRDGKTACIRRQFAFVNVENVYLFTYLSSSLCFSPVPAFFQLNLSKLFPFTRGKRLRRVEEVRDLSEDVG